MVRPTIDLWKLVRAAPSIDANSLARAVEDAADNAADFRTQLLIRDSLLAIEKQWGQQRFHDWLTHSPSRTQILNIRQSISDEAAQEHGFPSLQRRIVDAIDPDDIVQYLRDLARQVHRPTRLIIGGSIALTLSGNLLRFTEDIDVVDEIPEEIRMQHQFLQELDDRYGLQLTHFQSHYLPTGWETRIHSIGTFGILQIFVVDACDVLLWKLFSTRAKDRDDLRALLPHLDRPTLETRFRETTATFQAEQKLREAAEQNWYVLFGDSLPGV
ncbi:MAG TPA: DUF6036 family nucleotidyltransferase [Tepidisphaeraceae bacterium]|jgi:hypothetical protein|nr:DUF6036 family nucleotidyltransferase [Tepidisphaeraceae bacterium]